MGLPPEDTVAEFVVADAFFDRRPDPIGDGNAVKPCPHGCPVNQRLRQLYGGGCVAFEVEALCFLARLTLFVVDAKDGVVVPAADDESALGADREGEKSGGLLTLLLIVRASLSRYSVGRIAHPAKSI